MQTFLISTLQINSSSYLKNNLSTLVKSVLHSAVYFAGNYCACEYSWFGIIYSGDYQDCW